MKTFKDLGWILLCGILVFFPASWIWSDGGYVSKSESVAISTDQRAIIIKDGNEISMTFSTGYTGDGQEFGWIIPTPVSPAMEDVRQAGEDWEMALKTLAEYSDPTLFLGKRAPSVLFRTPFMPLVTADGQTALKRCKVSIIGAGDELALRSWLRENGFQTNPAAQEILDTYIRKNWAFVAVRLNPVEQRHYENEFLLALTIKYRHDQLIFPLPISAISTDRTIRISLFVMAESTVTSSNLPTTGLKYDIGLTPEVDPNAYIEACIRRTAGAGDRSGLAIMWSGVIYSSYYKETVERIVQRLTKNTFPRQDRIYLTRLETALDSSSMKEDIGIVLDSQPKRFDRIRLTWYGFARSDPAIDPRDSRGITLIAAAQIGDMDKVQELLRAGVDANLNGKSYGRTPLMVAARSGHTEVVQVLLQAGADVNAAGARGETALQMAALYGDPKIVEILLNEGAYVDKAALRSAAENGHIEIVELLLQAGADLNELLENGNRTLAEAARGGHTAIVEFLLQAGADVNAKDDYYSSTALMHAAARGHTEVVQVLLRAGADVAKYDHGYTPLISAAGNGYAEVVRILLHAGADVNAKREHDDGTALILAASDGHAEVVRILLQAGADVNARNEYGSTALIGAAWNGHAEVARILLQAGADVNAKDGNGSTALRQAVAYGHSEVVRILLRAGADANAKYGNGYTVLMVAASNFQFDTPLERSENYFESLSRAMMLVVQHLVAAGADVNATDKNSETALIGAVQVKRIEQTVIVKTLLDAGANVNVRDKTGNTALVYARKNNHREIVDLLIEAGAEE